MNWHPTYDPVNEFDWTIGTVGAMYSVSYRGTHHHTAETMDAAHRYICEQCTLARATYRGEARKMSERGRPDV